MLYTLVNENIGRTLFIMAFSSTRTRTLTFRFLRIFYLGLVLISKLSIFTKTHLQSSPRSCREPTERMARIGGRFLNLKHIVIIKILKHD